MNKMQTRKGCSALYQKLKCDRPILQISIIKCPESWLRVRIPSVENLKFGEGGLFLGMYDWVSD